ncbi:MAG: hypothetical protein IMZ64_03835 [Bacteroidetes bacterium]|nr:hypothetical protein [Bacteroidota bacterium]
MKRLIISLTILLAFTSCKGPGSGPLVKESFAKKDPNQNISGQNHKGQVMTEKIDVVVEPCGECITIAKLLAGKQSYSGKVIKIKGKVTKFNPAIMGKNWVHIQDGTEFEGGFDLTITTDKQASVGETITFEGKIVLDKDFGYGYFYNVLMEDGKSVL